MPGKLLAKLSAKIAEQLRKFPELRWHGRFATRFARIDSRESFAVETPIFIARQADSHESLEFPDSRESPDLRESCASIRENHATKFRKFPAIWPAIAETVSHWADTAPNIVPTLCCGFVKGHH